MPKNMKKGTKKFVRKQLTTVLAQRNKSKKIKRRRIEKEQKAEEREVRQKKADEEAAKDKLESPSDGGFAPLDHKEAEVVLKMDDVETNQPLEFAPKASNEQEDDESEASEALESDQESDTEAADEDEVAQHMKELEALEKTDPEFYAHLKKTSQGLLEFGQQGEETPSEPVPEAQEEDDIEAKPEITTKTHKRKQKELEKASTMDLKKFHSLAYQVSVKQSLSALKRMLRLWRAVCHADEESKQDRVNGDLISNVSNPQMFNAIARFCLRKLPLVCRKHLSSEDSAEATQNGADVELEKVEMLRKEASAYKRHQKWHIFEPLLKSFLGNLVHFLQKLSDPAMIRFVVVFSQHALPLFVVFPRLASRFIKHLTLVWATSSSLVDGSASKKEAKKRKKDDDDDDAEPSAKEEDEKDDITEKPPSKKVLEKRTVIQMNMSVRIDAFLRIRELLLLMPTESGMLDHVLKDMYLSYVRNAGFVTPTTLPQIAFMCNSLVEMYGMDPVASYQHAFVYIRQLAIHLRNAITHKTKDSYKTVYNWQYLNCLRCWAHVLCAHGDTKEKQLHPLIYPFVQVCISTIQLNPVARYFPLRFNVIRFLHMVSAACCGLSHITSGTPVDPIAQSHHVEGVYIPTASYLMSVFESAEFDKSPKNSSLSKAPDMKCIFRVADAVCHTRIYQQSVVSEAVSLLQEHFTIYSYSISFPELLVPVKFVQFFLKKFAKQTKVQQFRKQVTSLLDKLDTNAAYITSKRSESNFAPKDLISKGISGILTFLPDGSDNHDRTKAKSPLERIAFLRESTSEASSKSTKGSKPTKSNAADDESSEGEDEENEASQVDQVAAAEDMQTDEEEEEEVQEMDEDEDEAQEDRVEALHLSDSE